MSKTYVLGFLFGIVIVLAIALLARHHSPKGEYDERQHLMRGRAFRHGFLTMLVASTAYSMVTIFAERAFMEDGVSAMLTALLGLMVFAVDCVWHDAFFTVRSKPAVYLVLVGSVVLLDGINGIEKLRDGLVIRNGLLTFSSFALMFSAVFLVIFLAILLKLLVVKEAEE